MGAKFYYPAVSGIIAAIWLFVLGVSCLFVFTLYNIPAGIIMLIASVATLVVCVLMLVIRKPLFLLILAILVLVALVLLVVYNIYVVLSFLTVGSGFNQLLNGVVTSASEFVEEVQTIAQNTSLNTINNLNNAVLNKYNARLQSANNLALNQSIPDSEIAERVAAFNSEAQSREPDYESMLRSCESRGISPGVPTAYIAPYDNFLAYRIYETFASKGIFCFFSDSDIYNFKAWPVGCYKPCGYKELHIGIPFDSKTEPAKVEEALVKYVKALRKLTREDMEKCLCYSYLTVVALPTDYFYALYLVLITLWPLLSVVGCCCMLATPYAAIKSFLKGRKGDDD